MLDRRLGRLKHRLPDVIWIGKECDPYPSIERWRRVTRRTIEVIAKYSCPIFLITRSPLVLRDIDLIREIHESSLGTVAMALSSLNRKTARLLEPGSTPTVKRIETLIRVRRSGIQTGFVIPCLYPGLNDNPSDLEKLFRTTAESNFDFILFPTHYSHKNHGFVPLEDYPFEKDLAEYRPPFDPEGMELRKDEREINQLLLYLSKKYNISLRSKRYLPPDYRKENYWIAEKLSEIAYHRKLSGLSFRNHLATARKINGLDYDIRNIIKQGSLAEQNWIAPSVWSNLERLVDGSWVIARYNEGAGIAASK